MWSKNNYIYIYLSMYMLELKLYVYTHENDCTKMKVVILGWGIIR